MRILRRDCYVCQECGKRGATHVDHVVPRCEGGTDAEDNLVTLCDRCHARKSGREGARARNRVYPSRVALGPSGKPRARFRKMGDPQNGG